MDPHALIVESALTDRMGFKVKVRVKFSKQGVLKYIGHLDLMRYFQKAFRRTDIEVLYSKGFNPHMIMSFAQPLGVGLESFGEYFDIEVSDNENIDTMVDQLNATMAEGIKVLKVVKLPDNVGNAMASVMAADYELRFDSISPLNNEFIEAYNNADEVFFTKKTKSGERLINVKDYIYDIKVINDNILFLKTDASSSGNLKPQNALEAILGLLNKNITDYPFHIFRLDMYTKNESGELITLGDIC